VAGEDEAVVPVFRAGGHDQVELGAVGGGVPGDADTGPLEIVADEIDELAVALVAGGVEGDSPGKAEGAGAARPLTAPISVNTRRLAKFRPRLPVYQQGQLT